MKHGLRFRARCLAWSLCGCLALAAPWAQAQSGASAASTLSMLPVAVSAAVPVALLSSGAVLTVVSVQASAAGTEWVLERASDGVRGSVVVAGAVAGGVLVAAGTVVVVTAFSAGWVLSAAGQAIAYIPNQMGRALLHNERLTR